MTDHDVDLQASLVKLCEVLRRDVTNLMQESTSGKLSKDSANDLRLYLRLLLELGDRQEAEAERAAAADSGDATPHTPADSRRTG